MGLPQKLTLDDDLLALSQAARETEQESPRRDDPYAFWKSALERHSAQLDRMKSSLGNMEKKAASILAAVEKEVSNGCLSVSLDEMIAYYETVEEEFKTAHLPEIERAEMLKKETFSLPVSREDRARSIAMWDKAIRIHSKALEVVRDLRWQLMALRALIEPRGVEPVFSDPNELKAHLDKL
jgi:hypothetical protein